MRRAGQFENARVFKWFSFRAKNAMCCIFGTILRLGMGKVSTTELVCDKLSYSRCKINSPMVFRSNGK